MGPTHVADFYAYLSARYDVQPRAVYQGDAIIARSITPRAMNSMWPTCWTPPRRGLDYYQANFSPYQFAQYRIMEFPRYRNFAQSFPNTVPYSEGIGFISRVREEKTTSISRIS